MLTKDQIDAQTDFCAAMSIAKGLLAESAVTKQDYAKIHTFFKNKYAPLFKWAGAPGIGVEPPETPEKPENP